LLGGTVVRGLPLKAGSSVKKIPGLTRIVQRLPPSLISIGAVAVSGDNFGGDSR